MDLHRRIVPRSPRRGYADMRGRGVSCATSAERGSRRGAEDAPTPRLTDCDREDLHSTSNRDLPKPVDLVEASFEAASQDPSHGVVHTAILSPWQRPTHTGRAP